jgi:hypothetical protein
MAICLFGRKEGGPKGDSMSIADKKSFSRDVDLPFPARYLVVYLISQDL